MYGLPDFLLILSVSDSVFLKREFSKMESKYYVSIDILFVYMTFWFKLFHYGSRGKGMQFERN